MLCVVPYFSHIICHKKIQLRNLLASTTWLQFSQKKLAPERLKRPEIEKNGNYQITMLI